MVSLLGISLWEPTSLSFRFVLSFVCLFKIVSVRERQISCSKNFKLRGNGDWKEVKGNTRDLFSRETYQKKKDRKLTDLVRTTQTRI